MKKFNAREALVYGWETYKKNWKFFLVLLLIVWGAYAILNGLTALVAEKVSFVGGILRVFAWVAEVIIGIGVIKVSLDVVSNRKPDFKELYTNYGYFWNYIGGSILYFLIVLGGTLLLVVPGIYWGLKYHFVLYSVVDRRMGPIEGLKNSAKITRGSLMELLILGIALIAINILGAILFMIGLLVTVPVTMLATAHVYKKLS